MKVALNNKGFTLLEVMVVIALTAVIMGLVFVPLYQSFDLMRRADIMVSAQDNARLALAQISRDLADAMYVYDNTRDPVSFPALKKDGTPTTVPVYHAKVDLVLPRMRWYCPNDASHTPGGLARDLGSLQEATRNCPSDGVPMELRPVQPLAPETVIVRYFIGLADPGGDYANKFDRRLTSANKENLYVLYRAEFSPFDDKDGKNALFPKGRTANENLSDPDFFYRTDNNDFGEPYWKAWKKISRPIVTVNHTDLVTIEYDDSGNPLVTPTVRFAPTAVYNDPMTPTTDSKDDPELGDETPPSVYKATYGHWVLPYEVYLTRKDETTYSTKADSASGHMCIYRDDNLVFDITGYESSRSSSPYGAGNISPSMPELAFTVDTIKGTVNFAFPVVDTSYSQTAALLGGAMTVSAQEDTSAINSGYEASQADPYEDVYRKMIVNRPGQCPVAGGRVVPGSVRVFGPDAQPGAQGTYIRYSRLPYFLHDPGLNQFTVDADYHRDGGGNSVPGTAAIFFHSMQTQEPGSGVPLPDGGTIFAYYEVQNNKPGDMLRASYVTKSLMTVTLGIRIYDPGTGDPVSIQLTNKVRLRNIAT